MRDDDRMARTPRCCAPARMAAVGATATISAASMRVVARCLVGCRCGRYAGGACSDPTSSEISPFSECLEIVPAVPLKVGRGGEEEENGCE